MPLVTIKGPQGVLTLEQKQEMMKKIADAVVSVEGERMRPLTWVIFEDVEAGHWSLGGTFIGPDEVRAVQSGSVSVRDAIGA